MQVDLISELDAGGPLNQTEGQTVFAGEMVSPIVQWLSAIILVKPYRELPTKDIKRLF